MTEDLKNNSIANVNIDEGMTALQVYNKFQGAEKLKSDYPKSELILCECIEMPIIPMEELFAMRYLKRLLGLI